MNEFDYRYEKKKDITSVYTEKIKVIMEGTLNIYCELIKSLHQESSLGECVDLWVFLGDWWVELFC